MRIWNNALRPLPLLAALAGLLLAEPAARAGDPLRDQISELAREIQKIAGQEKQECVAVGDFTGPTGALTSFGPAIQHALMEELAALKVRVEKKAELEVKGDYKDVPNPDKSKDTHVLKLIARVFNGNGDEVGRIAARVVDDNLAYARAMGITAPLDPRADKETRNQELQKRFNAANVFKDRTLVRSCEGSPFGVEILVKSKPEDEARPRAVTVKDGLAFVPLNPGETYEVHLVNNAPFDAAATLTIDGLDQFTFSDVKDPNTGRPRYTHRIVGKSGAGVVKGWHHTNEEVFSFLTTEYGKGAASQYLHGSPAVGTITVTFAAAWEADADRPADEAGKGGSETGVGPPVKDVVTEVHRTIGAVRDVITIRYNKAEK